MVRLAAACDRAFSHANLNTLFYEFGVEGGDPGATTNKLNRSLRLLQELERRQAWDSIHEIAEAALANQYVRENAEGLLAALALDGFEWGPDRLVPTNPGAAPLAPEITFLEQTLAARGLQVSAAHYRQAVDNFSDGNYEASNGQLRSFLEDLFSAGGRLFGGQANVGPDAAIQHLFRVGRLDEEEHKLLRALWSAAQDNGPHAGLTNLDEARFRLHAHTAAARYFLSKLA